MATNDTHVSASAPLPITMPAPRDETKKLGFWVSQCFILVATVLGVYLASSQGFKQAIAYGEIQSTKANYYLRKSLRDELVGNVPLVREYLKGVATGSPSARNAPIVLETFVMECLKSSANTLETPTELLAESRKFYRDVEDVQKKIANQTYAIGFGQEKMLAAVDQLEKTVLPKFDADLRALKSRLQGSGVAVE